MIHRVYVGGPLSSPDAAVVDRNTEIAKMVCCDIMLRGHDVFCPHTHSIPLDRLLVTSGRSIHYERWMRLDFGLIRHWATAFYYIGSSPGTDRELELVKSLGLPVWTNINEVPIADS